MEADRMVELPESIRPRFVEAGWHPGRRSPVSPAVPMDHPAAKILAEFGGLTVDPPEEGGPYSISFRELWPDESILRVWAGLLDTRLIGIADLGDAHGELYAAADGRIFGRSCMHDAFWFEGDSFFAAVERSLSGRRHRPLLRPDQSSVTLYGIRFTDDSPEVYRYR
jgi:SUKH-3 immunity protein